MGEVHAASALSFNFARGTNASDRGQSRGLMSIEKNSSGIPEVNVHQWTTTVNLSMIVGIGIFFDHRVRHRLAVGIESTGVSI